MRERFFKIVFILLTLEGLMFDFLVYMNLQLFPLDVNLVDQTLQNIKVAFAFFMAINGFLTFFSIDDIDIFSKYITRYLIVGFVALPAYTTMGLVVASDFVYVNFYFWFPALMYLMHMTSISFMFNKMGEIHGTKRLKFASYLIATQFLSPIGVIMAYSGMKTMLRSSEQASKHAAFKVEGLPAGVNAIVIIGGKTYEFNETLHIPLYSYTESWHALDINSPYGVYKPDLSWGYVTPGDVITLKYTLVKNSETFLSPRSRSISKPLLTTWDTKVWLNKKIGTYTVLKYLGEGGYGYVLSAKSSNDELVAIRIFKLFSENLTEFFAKLGEEAMSLVNLSDHPNIIKIYGFYVDSVALNKIINGDVSQYLINPPIMVMELMKDNLQDLLKDDNFYYSHIWEKVVYKAVADVSLALKYLHGHGYVYMDVKPSNIFLAKDKPNSPRYLLNVGFKLGDLGSALRVSSKINQLTLEYSPPEVFEGIAKPLLDIFALGMTIYVLLNRKADRPDLVEMNEAFDCYVKHDLNCVSLKISEAKTKLSSWQPNLPDEIENFVKRMLSPDPSTRPTAEEVFNYFSRLVGS
ncbi:serine/threonine-protein kinase [Sulfolobus sp. S-194]|uniref:protein kinase domain-containing protein n=1 Tax=Sulfolobus sp. S-194 TaxID=2512240 RepID=UPI001437068D|nr:protein kinase [Sulfolobus sp. S-194]QIW23088.1 serine/threonine-protein kinase [Sulfolobus sp. S-194]